MYYYYVGAIKSGSAEVCDISGKTTIQEVREFMYRRIIRYWNNRHEICNFFIYKAGQTKSTLVGSVGSVRRYNSIDVVWMENKKTAHLTYLNPDGSVGDRYTD